MLYSFEEKLFEIDVDKQEEIDQKVNEIIEILNNLKSKKICQQCDLSFTFENFNYCWQCCPIVFTNTERDDLDVCSICYEKQNFFSIKTSCEHYFHSKCLYNIVQNGLMKCPICRNTTRFYVGKNNLLTESPNIKYLDFLTFHSTTDTENE